MARWSAKWRTKVSINKTKYIVFHKGRNHNQNTLHLTYNKHKLERDPHPVFLGLTLDPYLRFQKHAEAVANRCTRRINMLKRIRGPGWGAYKVLIRPIIDYVPFATITMSKPQQLLLEKLQRAAVRITTH